MSLSSRILVGLVAGVLSGIFFGEPLGSLAVFGDAFIRLLQMTVLPYVVVSLIAGLGHLDLAQARRIGFWGGALLVLLWGLSFLLVAVMPLAFPHLETASFYSTSLAESAPEVNFVELYIPSNPFHSLANNVVPAVVVFSLAVGVALIGVPDRQSLLRGLDTLSEAFLKINAFVVRLTPAGVFAIAASAAGTMTVEEFQRVQVYLVSYALFALIATFWLLPGLLAALTPVRHRDVLLLLRDALITAFATGSSFVVIPLIAKASKQLLSPHVSEHDEADSVVDVVVPASHTFPHAAKVLTLSFVLFAGWSIDSPVSPSSYPLLAVSGIASTFGSVNVAIPYLLDQMRIPHDLVQLFIATSVVNARFGTLLQTMHVLVLTVLTTAAIAGGFRFRWRPVLRYAALSALIIAAAVAGTRAFYALAIDTTYRKAEILAHMQLVWKDVPSTVHREPPPAPPPGRGPSRLDTIMDRGVLRVGYRATGALPFAYFNADGRLVGFDIEMAHSLARGLGVSIEFVPLDVSLGDRGLDEPLDSGYCDVIMSRAVMSMDSVTKLAYSKPYLDLNLGFLVRDHRRHEFSIRGPLVRREGLRIAVPDVHYYLDRVAEFLPNAELVPVSDIDDFLSDPNDRFDALVYIAEAGSAWTLLYPAFSVVIPDPPFQELPLAYPLPLRDPEWKGAVDSWLELKRTDGTIETLYDYWILGREAEQRPPRWSVARDVLGWID